jgi:stringent starvation protein B
MMTSSRPYLIRALYEWIVDNNMTPYILVDARNEDVSVPQGHVRDGRIVLNVSPNAVRGLHMDNEAVSFSARFNGQSMELLVPTEAVMAVYAQENGKGMFFEQDGDMEPPPREWVRKEKEAETVRPVASRPTLKVVK